MPPQPGSPGRPGQAYTGLGAFRRAQGAQSRFALPQTGLALERTGQRAAAGAAGMREEWMRLWGRLAERERAEKLAAIGALGRTVGLGIESARGRREDERERERRLALARLGPQPYAGAPSGPGAAPRGFAAPPEPGPYGALPDILAEGRGFPRGRLEREVSEEELREYLEVQRRGYPQFRGGVIR